MEKVEAYQIEMDDISDKLGEHLGVSLDCMYHDDQCYGTGCYDLVHADKELTEYEIESFEKMKEEYEYGGDSTYLDRDLKYLVHVGILPKGKYLVRIDY